MRIIRMTAAADKVLSIFVAILKTQKKTLPFGPHAEIVIAPYVNGRENGWTVEVFDGTLAIPGVTFSENRNSDEIVVYADNRRLFIDKNREAHEISDDAYDTRKYFRYNGSQDAAVFALKSLVKTYEEIKKEEEAKAGKE